MSTGTFYKIALTEEEGDGPDPGKGYFTDDDVKIEDSDFDIPEGADYVHVKGQMDKDEKPYFTEIHFTQNKKQIGEPIQPPNGSKPNNIEYTLR